MQPTSESENPSLTYSVEHDEITGQTTVSTRSSLNQLASSPLQASAVTGLSKPRHSALSELLTYLAFEGHGLRIGLELGSCIVLFAVIENLLHWLQPSPAGSPAMTIHGLVAWFSSCSLVVAFDQFFLCRPVYIYRNAYQLALRGEYERALRLLEFIAPERQLLVRCPATIFHLMRADIYTSSETFAAAENEILRAEKLGAKPDQVAVAKSRLYSALSSTESYTLAIAELDKAEQQHGPSALLAVEKGLLHLESRQDLWMAKRTLKQAGEMEDQPHFSGDYTSNIARAGLEATKLWTGEAEEGLVGLTDCIDRLRSLALHVDTLRPLLSWLLLERSHYLATHSEPEAACLDLRMSMAICKSPRTEKRAVKIREELEWRYQIIVP